MPPTSSKNIYGIREQTTGDRSVRFTRYVGIPEYQCTRAIKCLAVHNAKVDSMENSSLCIVTLSYVITRAL